MLGTGLFKTFFGWGLSEYAPYVIYGIALVIAFLAIFRVIHQPGDGCLLLVDPQFTSEEAYPGLPENLAKNFEMSNIGQVEQNGDNMAVPSRYFGAEPARNWCDYFEKAELARQYGDWEEVVMHYETASSSGFTALQPVENLVFIEAFARLGNTDKASRLTETVLSRDRNLCRALSDTWKRAGEASPEIQAERP